MTLADDIGAWLVAGGYGVVGSTLFYYTLPDSPDNCIMVNPWGGPPPTQALGSGAIDEPSVQVQVRNTSKATALATAEAIRTGLDRAAVNGSVFCFTTRSTPIFLGADENDRYKFSVDFRLARAR